MLLRVGSCCLGLNYRGLFLLCLGITYSGPARNAAGGTEPRPWWSRRCPFGGIEKWDDSAAGLPRDGVLSTPAHTPKRSLAASAYWLQRSITGHLEQCPAAYSRSSGSSEIHSSRPVQGTRSVVRRSCSETHTGMAAGRIGTCELTPDPFQWSGRGPCPNRGAG